MQEGVPPRLRQKPLRCPPRGSNSRLGAALRREGVPPRLRLLLALAVIALCAGCDTATSVAARAGLVSFEERCEQKLPKTTIDIVAAPIEYATDRDRSYTELTQMSGETSSAVHAFGLTTAEISHHASLETAGIEDTRSGRTCVRPAIRVELAMTPMTVYVSREVTDDPCRAATILEHELKHVAVYRERLAEVGDEVRAALVRTYDNRVFYFSNRAEGQRQMEWALSQQLGTLLDDNARQIKQRQRQVDSPEEYARVAAACGGIRVDPQT